MIAKTVIGNNVFGLGLISHVMAIVSGMLTIEEGEILSVGYYLLGCLFIIIGIFVEFNIRQKRILSNFDFYSALALSLLSIIGPILVFWILYSFSKEENQPTTAGNFIASIFTLKVHPLALLVWSTLLFIILAVLFQQNDPYFFNRDV